MMVHLISSLKLTYGEGDFGIADFGTVGGDFLESRQYQGPRSAHRGNARRRR
jgi:hypothetical protein